MNKHQSSLLEVLIQEFSSLDFVLAGFLLGSFASGNEDNLSDFDICLIVEDTFWDGAKKYSDFLTKKFDVVYSDNGYVDSKGSYSTYIFSNFTSCEVHFISASSDFQLYKPYKTLFGDIAALKPFLRDGNPPDKSEYPAFPAFPAGIDNAAWDVFNIFKKAVRKDLDGVVQWAKKVASD